MTRAVTVTATALIAALAAPLHADTRVTAELTAGGTTTPFATATLPRATGYGTVLVASGRRWIMDATWITADLPLAIIDVRQPAGSYASQTAWGNPMLSAEHVLRTPLPRLGGASLIARIQLGIGLPLARRGGPGWMAHRALAIADALLGWRHPEQFAPGMWPIAADAALTAVAGRWSVTAGARLPMLVRVADGDPGVATHGLAVFAIAELDGRVQLTPRFAITAGAAATQVLAAPVVWMGDPSSTQASVRVGVDRAIGARMRLACELLAPLAGPLGGHTLAGTFKISAAL